jgi:membrane protease subunit HflK
MSDSPPRNPFPPNTFPDRPDIQVNPKMVVAAGILGLIVIAIWTSVFTVRAESEGVVMRFGKYTGTVSSGLHFKLPFGIDQVDLVPVRRQLKQEFGFGSNGNTNLSQSSNQREWADEKAMVTGDLNAALVEWVIQYRIENPKSYLFNVRNADDTLRDASESIMREVVGDRTVDEVITIGRQEIENETLIKLQALVESYEMGIKIDQVQLKDVNPPTRVQASFNEVNQAQQERESAINNANGEYNKSIPRARGEADQLIKTAEGYATQRINEAEGDAASFNAQFTEYLKAPEVTKQRLYLETMGTVLPRVGRKIILDKDASGVLPLLNLGGAQNLMNGGKQ